MASLTVMTLARSGSAFDADGRVLRSGEFSGLRQIAVRGETAYVCDSLRRRVVALDLTARVDCDVATAVAAEAVAATMATDAVVIERWWTLKLQPRGNGFGRDGFSCDRFGSDGFGLIDGDHGR